MSDFELILEDLCGTDDPTVDGDTRKTCNACAAAGNHGRYKDSPHTPCPPCGGYTEHHPPGDETLCWAGRARMAQVQSDLGHDLTDLDRQALERTSATFLHPSGGYR